jgi:hypothetical protein
MMKRANPKMLTARRALMLAMTIAPFAMVGEVEACTVNGAVSTHASNATVDCVGNTTNSGPAGGPFGTIGYGSAVDINNAYNIAAGATVSGTLEGIEFSFNDKGTFKVFGTVTATGAPGTPSLAGILGGDADITVFSGGVISGFHAMEVNNLILDNAGQLNSTSTVPADGTVVAKNANVINRSGGSISGLSNALGIDRLDLDNAGLIEATDANGVAIGVGTIIGTVHVNANTGHIQALATGGIAIQADIVTVSNGSTGSITGDGFGIQATTSVTVGNAGGTIQGTNGSGISAATGTVTVTGNTGTILGGNFGIDAGNADITNSNLITGGDTGIHATGTVRVANAGGTISGRLGTGITAATVIVTGNTGTISGFRAGISTGNADITNSNLITGVLFGILATGTVTVANAGGTISADGNGITAATVIVTGNTGTISGGNIGINADNADITNSNLITGGNEGIFSTGTVTVANAGGTISATNANGIGIFANTVNVTANSGAIEATGASGIAISAKDTATVRNAASGRIRANGADGIAIKAVTANVTGNAGTIEATGAGGVGISVATADINNTRTGTISGNIAIQATGTAGVGSTIVNAGAIVSTAGPTGTAIKLSAAADTLTLLSGSRIVGIVDMGDLAQVGNDTVNVMTVAPSSKVSPLTTAAELPTLIHFHGKLNTSFSGGGFNGPTVQSGIQLATLDPTALAQADRTLMDFTGGVSSLVQGRLNGVPASSNGAMTAMSYAPETGNAGPFAKAPGKNADWTNPAPITVWSSSFGGQRSQDATAETLRATSTAWGGAIGIDRKMRPDWLVGAFIGGGQGGLSVDLSSQKVDTDYVFAGGYSRFE